jgi:hypothetical protein
MAIVRPNSNGLAAKDGCRSTYAPACYPRAPACADPPPAPLAKSASDEFGFRKFHPEKEIT